MSRLSKIFGAMALVLGLGASGLVCQRVAERGRFAVPYSTYGSGPNGTRALFLLAQSEHLGATRWASDFSGMPEGGMIVALGGCDSLMRRPLSRFEGEELEHWIDRGGVLLVAGANGYLPEDSKVHLEAAEGCEPGDELLGALAGGDEQDDHDGDDPNGEPADEETDESPPDFGSTARAIADLDDVAPPVWAIPVGGPLSGLGAVPLRRPGPITVDAGTDHTELLSLPNGSAGVAVRQGRGLVIVLAAASLFQNRDVASSDGAVLFSRLAHAYAPHGPIVFDEFHLGVGERRSLGQYVRSIGAGPIAIQILIVVLFALFRLGARFGGVKRAPPEEPAGTASYVGAVGALYQKSRDSGGAAQLLVRNALSRIAAYHHLGATSPDVMARVLDDRKRADAATAVRALFAVPATKMKPRELVERAREIDALTARAMREP